MVGIGSESGRVGDEEYAVHRDVRIAIYFAKWLASAVAVCRCLLCETVKV